MHISKYFWGIRALFYRLRMPQVGFPSYIGKPLYLNGTRNICIGKNVRIFPGIRMEALGEGRIVIDDDTYIGQNCHIIADGEDVYIGKSCTIASQIFITNIDHAYQEINVPILRQPHSVRHTSIGDNSFIGFGAVIQAGTVLGRQCIVGAHSVVRGTFPDYCVIAGVPARIIKKYNEATQKWEKVHPRKECEA